MSDFTIFPVEKVPSNKRMYSENMENVQKAAGRIGCSLLGFDPDWQLCYQNQPCIRGVEFIMPYEVMRELVLKLGYNWIEKK